MMIFVSSIEHDVLCWELPPTPPMFVVVVLSERDVINFIGYVSFFGLVLSRQK